MKSINHDNPVKDWERQNDQGNYQCRSSKTLELCSLAMNSTAKSKARLLLDTNISLLKAHHSLEKNGRIRNRCERVIDYLEAKKDKPDLAFNTRFPVQFQ